MAMYVTTQINAPHGQISQHHWLVGEKTFKLDRYETVIEVEAFGDELDEILLRIGGIPHAKHKRVQTWRGDFAAFIWDNL